MAGHGHGPSPVNTDREIERFYRKSKYYQTTVANI